MSRPFSGTGFQPRILLVSHVPPSPPTSGGRQRMQLLWSSLSTVGDVDLLLITPDSPATQSEPDLSDLKARFRLVGVLRGTNSAVRDPTGTVLRAIKEALYRWRRFSRAPGADPQLAAGLAHQLSTVSYDLVCIFQLSNLWSSDALRHGRVVADVDDLMYEVFERRARVTPWWSALHWMYRWKAKRAKEWTQDGTRRVTHLFVAKPEDREFFGEERTTLLPNVPFNDAQCLRFPDATSLRTRAVLLIVASLGYHPNVDGIDHFVRRIWPSLSERHPAAVLRIVGAGLDRRTRERWSHHGVELPGFVTDLRTEYANALFSVVPVRYGAGTNIKFLEAMSYGRTVVTTPKGAAGYGHVFNEGEHFLLGDSEAALLAACQSLLTDPARAEAMGRVACEVTRRRFTRDIFVRSIQKGVAAAFAADETVPEGAS